MVVMDEPWSKWIVEGHYISYKPDANLRKFFYVDAHEIAPYEFYWPHSVAPLTMDGPLEVLDMEITAWDEEPQSHNGQIHQFIFGSKYNVFTGLRIPSDSARHGISKRQEMTTGYPWVANFTMQMSPWNSPSFVTEHFLVRPDHLDPWLLVYNPTPIAITPAYKFLINKLSIVKIGEEQIQGASVIQVPAQPYYTEILDRLVRKIQACKPLTFGPLRIPAKAAR